MPRTEDGTGWKARDTAEAAAHHMDSRAGTIRRSALAALKLHGPMTVDEIGHVLTIDRLSVRPRISELAEEGKVRDTGLRREAMHSHRNMIVWEATPSLRDDEGKVK